MAWFNQIPIWILIQITFQYRFITNTSDIFSNSKEKGVNSGVYWKFERREILCSKIWLGSGNIPSFLINRYWCLVLLQVPKCFGLVQFFCARPKIYFYFVAVTNILCQTKRWFAFSKIGFFASTNIFEEGLNTVKFLGWHKIFGPAQNILGPVKGQGISMKPILRQHKILLRGVPFLWQIGHKKITLLNCF